MNNLHYLTNGLRLKILHIGYPFTQSCLYVCVANIAIIEGKIWETGHSYTIITEEILKEIYGVEVKVRSLENKQECNRLVYVPRVKIEKTAKKCN